MYFDVISVELNIKKTEKLAVELQLKIILVT